jgi:hypothetical protein
LGLGLIFEANARMRRHGLGACGAVCVLIVLVLCGTAAADERGRLCINAESVWQRGGADDDLFFGLVHGVLGDDNDHTYVLDKRLAHIVVLDSEGQFLRTLGRSGDGPGELRHPHASLWMPDGSLGLLQGLPGRLVTRNLDNIPGPDLRLDLGSDSGLLMAFGVRSGGGRIVVAGSRLATESGAGHDYVMADIDRDGRVKQILWSAARPLSLQDAPFVEVADSLPSTDLWDVASDGTVAHAPRRDSYLIRLHRTDGSIETLARHKKHRQRSAAELYAASEPFAVYQQRYGDHIDHQLMTHAPDITSVQFDSGGLLWVRTSRSDPPFCAAGSRCWDVFSPKGSYMGEIQISWPGARPDDRVWFMPNGGMVVVRGVGDAQHRSIPEKRKGVAKDSEIIVMRLAVEGLPSGEKRIVLGAAD